MTDPNTKKCSRMKRLVDLLTTVIAVVVAQIIADHFFEKPLVWTLLIMVIFWVILSPIGLLLHKKIDAYYVGKLEA